MTVYLDHAATSPLRAEARDAWLRASDAVGNASSVHGPGQAARRLLEDAREQIAVVLGCDPIEVVLTSGGTEAINLAVKGLWWAAGGGAIVLPDGEHHATTDAVAWLHRQGAAVRPVALEPTGAVDLRAFRAALSEPDRAALATALVAHNEIGTLNDPVALAAAASDAGIPLHLDAVAALGHVDVDVRRWRGDAPAGAGLVALSVSGHKIGAPVGTGALVVARSARIEPLVHGGGQQRGLRSGTPDVAGAAAFAAALTAAEAEREGESTRLADLRDRLVRGIRSITPDADVLGHPTRRLPGTAHVLFPGVSGETLLFLLDQQRIAVSTGAACQAGVAEPSHVVLALGLDERAARSVVRFTLGRSTTAADVDAVLAALPEAHARASAAGRRA
jgi:cysteine desulfurase